MESDPNNQLLKNGEIRFPNDNRAVFVKASTKDDPTDIIKALKINTPSTVIVLLGGADELDPSLAPKIHSLLDKGLAAAASDADALIVDGGTQAGVMALIGKAIATRGRVTPLLGVAPEGKVTYPSGPEEGTIPEGAALDPNHSHFVLAEGTEWSDGTEMMFKLVTQLAITSPVVVMLVNGGDEARAEVTRAAKLGWPVIAVHGSGRLADDVAKEIKFTDQGDFDVFQLEDNPAGLRDLISQHAEGGLREAWLRYLQYEATSVANQAIHMRLLSFTLIIGVFGTLFALTQSQFANPASLGLRLGWLRVISFSIAAIPVLVLASVSFLEIFKPKSSKKQDQLIGWGILAVVVTAVLMVLATDAVQFLQVSATISYYLAIAVPIVVSTLVATSNQFSNRRKWILLRDAAETIKKEIFRYRTRVGDYREQPQGTDGAVNETSLLRSRNTVLHESVVRVTLQLMETEVKTGRLLSKSKIPPDGFSYLSPERYIRCRLEDQMDYYNWKTKKLQRQRLEFQVLIYVVGGIGTLLGAFKQQLWVALTTATVTALTAWIADLKIEVNLVKFNQTAALLSNVRYWWSTLSSQEKSKDDNRQKLVNDTENILAGERLNWVQQMEELPKKPEAKKEPEAKTK